MTIYDLITMAKNGEPLPEKIQFDGLEYSLICKDDPGQDYLCSTETDTYYLSAFAFDPHGGLDNEIVVITEDK